MKTEKHIFPDWVLSHKRQGCELRHINGRYYLYEVSSRYDQTLKRAKKITGRILGSITPKDGFIPSKKRNGMNDVSREIAPIVCREYGLSEYVFNLFDFVKEALADVFPEHWKMILSLVYCRLGWQAPLKNVPYLIEHSALKEFLNVEGCTEKNIRKTLSFLGGHRGLLRDYMQKFVHEGAYNLIDATEFFSKSKRLSLAEKGYNKDMVFDRQISLLYLYSATDKMPVFYRLLAGNLREVKTMKLTIQESNIENAVIVADKGFYSKSNINELKDNDLQFIIPLRRDNTFIDYGLLTGIESQKNYFKYKGRYIYHATTTNRDGDTCILYFDGKLKEDEKTDYLNRMSTLPESFTHEKFSKKLPAMGTISLLTNLEEPRPEELYLTYKSRANIEQMFDNLKNILDADRSYMQNDDMLEGWMFVNHVALQYCHLLFKKLKDNDLLKAYSIQDILFFLKELKQIRIHDQWKRTEVVSKISKVFEKIGLHIT